MHSAMNRRGVLRAMVCGAGGALLAVPAHAWLRPPRYLFEAARAAVGPTPGFHVVVTGRVRGDGGPDAARVFTARWVFDRAAARLEVAINGPQGATAAWRRGGEAQGDPRLVPDPLERLCLGRLFVDPPTGAGAGVPALARDVGADVSRQRLTLLGGDVVDIVGEAPGDAPAPHLAFDHEHGWLRRVAWRQGGELSVYELSGWIRAGGPSGVAFPRTARLTRGGRWLCAWEAALPTPLARRTP